MVYIAIDSGHATARTHGHTTGGWMAGPAVSHVITRIGPMLDVLPRFDNIKAINQELAIPTPYPVPPGVTPLGPNNPGETDDTTTTDRTAEHEKHHAKMAASL